MSAGKVSATTRWLGRRPFVLALAGAILIGAQGLSLRAASQRSSAIYSGVEPSSESFGMSSVQAGRARKIIADNNCLVCHRLADAGGAAGPDLTNYAERNIRADDLMVFLKNPTSWYPSTTMPGYPDLSTTELKLVANYLTGLIDPARLRRLPRGADLEGGVCGPRFVPMGEKNSTAAFAAVKGTSR